MRAFTLLELLISVGLSGALAAGSLLIGIGAYQQALGRSDGSLLSFAYSFAGLESLQGMCRHGGCTTAEAHGVRVTPGIIELFEGTSYAERWPETLQEVPRAGATDAAPSSTTIYFPDGSVSSTTP